MSKHPALAIIMGGPKHSDEDEEPETDEGGRMTDQDGLDASAKFLKAQKAGDAEMLWKAFCTMADIHAAHEADEDEDMDEDDGDDAGKDY